MAKLKGICTNIDGCVLAEKKVVQEAEKSNFICSDAKCGKPLKPIKTPTTTKTPKPIILIIAALIIIGGCIGAWLGGLFDSSSSTSTEENVLIDSIPPYPTFSWGKFDGEYNNTDKCYVGIINITSNAQIDINGKAINIEPKGFIKNAKIKEGNIIISGDYIKPADSIDPTGPKFSWCKYSGPAEGFGGELKVTKEHSIDLRNTRGEILDVYPGDVIKQTKIKNGQLVGGFLIRTDGTRKTFEIGI